MVVVLREDREVRSTSSRDLLYFVEEAIDLSFVGIGRKSLERLFGFGASHLCADGGDRHCFCRSQESLSILFSSFFSVLGIRHKIISPEDKLQFDEGINVFPLIMQRSELESTKTGGQTSKKILFSNNKSFMCKVWDCACKLRPSLPETTTQPRPTEEFRQT